MAKSSLSSLAIVIIVIVALWAVASLFGFRISLWWSIIGSVILTIVLNLVLGMFRRGS